MRMTCQGRKGLRRCSWSPCLACMGAWAPVLALHGLPQLLGVALVIPRFASCKPTTKKRDIYAAGRQREILA